MSVRLKNGKWIVEPYDPTTQKKRLLTHADIRELGFEPPTNERAAKRIERTWQTQEKPDLTDETCDEFASRWTRDYPRNSPSSNKANQYRVSRFIEEFAGRPLRTITKTEARRFAQAYPDRYNAIRSMFSDAVKDGLLKENPFSGLDVEKSKGREDLVIPSKDDIHDLADIALSVLTREQDPFFAQDMSAFILWTAYTAMRAGEACRARYNKLEGDLYLLDVQWNNRLRMETPPKNGATGQVFVPRPARDAVLSKPRALDGYMFHTPEGVAFKYDRLLAYWSKVRTVFADRLPKGHPLYGRAEKLTMHELRHFGASYMLNELKLEPWVIAEQLRHKDGGKLVLSLYAKRVKRASALDYLRESWDSDTSSNPAYGAVSPHHGPDSASEQGMSA